MRYYILYPGNTEADTVNSINQLGDASFKTFWAQRGLNILMNAVVEQHADLEKFIIKDEKGKDYSGLKCQRLEEMAGTMTNLHGRKDHVEKQID